MARFSWTNEVDWFPGKSFRSRAALRVLPSLLLIALVLLGGAGASAQVASKKDVLIINEVGMSHPLTATVTQQIIGALQKRSDRNVEFYSESLDLMSFQGNVAPAEVKDWLIKKYGGYELDAIVAVGPDAVNFLSNYVKKTDFNVPIVICGSSAGQAGNPKLDSRFTGTWMKFEPEKSIETALRLFPDTRHVTVVGGTSSFDRIVVSITKKALSSFQSRVDLDYLTDMEMEKLLDQLRHQPEHSIVLFLSFFQDAAGQKFLNATNALPMIAEASNAPVFGVSDTYLGHGIVGGSVMRYQEQAAHTSEIVSELLDGKRAEDIPIETLPSVYMFDWKELQRWGIAERNLPEGSVVLFRDPSLWDRTKWAWVASIIIILGLSALIVYLQFSRKELELAKEKERHLSGMLISAGEVERSHIAMELHDDFSQRLALLSLGLENAADAIPASPREAQRQLHGLLNSASEIGADLHTLSHRLHSSTLERLGLVSGVGALCREFQAQQGINVDFRSEDVTKEVAPDAALCVFRIVQEGLRNLKKHSGTSSAQVSLVRTSNSIRVSISDAGVGFDVRGLSSTAGLGVRSMEERAHLLGGRFRIRSEPGRGTDVEAWVPCLPHKGPAKS
jgi:signal transduction histidine kinase